MLPVRVYVAVARLSALALGTGSLLWTAGDPGRVELLLGQCQTVYRHKARPGPDNGPAGLQWSGCETLAKELGISGSLILLGALPVRRPDSG